MPTTVDLLLQHLWPTNMEKLKTKMCPHLVVVVSVYRVETLDIHSFIHFLNLINHPCSSARNPIIDIYRVSIHYQLKVWTPD